MDIINQVPAPKAPNMKARRALAISLAVLASFMIIGAGGFAAYPFYTNLRADRVQAELRKEFLLAKNKTAYKTRRLKEGSPLTRIRIPTIGTDAMVVQGISLAALNTGAGHYPMTPLPGEKGNVGIAGHRTMYGKPFNRMDELKSGDKIILTTPFAKYTYEVIPAFDGHANPWVIKDNNWDVVNQTTDAVLTLTTCHPKGSSKQRLVVRAKLVKTERNA